MNTFMHLMGPAGAGKTTATERLQRLVGSQMRLVVIDRDVIGKMYGVHTSVPYSRHHHDALSDSFRHAIEDSLRALEGGYDVILVTPALVSESFQIAGTIQKFGPKVGGRPPNVIRTMLIPPWTQVEAQQRRRMQAADIAAGVTPEADALGDMEGVISYQSQLAMVEGGICDLVIDGANHSPKQVAKMLGGAILAMNEFGVVPPVKDLKSTFKAELARGGIA